MTVTAGFSAQNLIVVHNCLALAVALIRSP
jgi:hypothetical protein